MYKSSRLPLSGSGGGLAQSDSVLAGSPGIGGSNPAPGILLFLFLHKKSKLEKGASKSNSLPGPGEFFFWAHFRLSLCRWSYVLRRLQ